MRLILPLFFFVLIGCQAEPEPTFIRNPKKVIEAEGISVEVYDYENFKPFLHQNDDQIHVVNFWATWCIPCVAELPFFEQLGEEYPAVKVTLVSLDFPKLLEKNLVPFIRENELKSEVIVLDEPNGNVWIPEIDPNWSGAIPATLIYRNNKSEFYEQSFTFGTLEKTIMGFQN